MTGMKKREQVAAEMAARQKKRNDNNIAMRNDERKNDKKGSSKKARPGFDFRGKLEGLRKGYIEDCAKLQDSSWV